MTRSEILFTGVAIALCVALAGAAVCVLGVPLGPLSPYLDIFAQFAPQAGFGAALIALAYGVMRLKAMAVLALVTALLSLFVTRPAGKIAACETGEASHRVVFLNLWNGNPSIDDTMSYLATLNADAIVLVEMRPGFQLALNRLVNDYKYQTACPGNCSALILSRSPIEEITPSLTLPGGPRSLAAAKISYGDGELTLIGVHLYRPWPFNRPVHQATEARTLALVAAPLEGPRFVLGDFNAAPWGAIVTALAREARLTPLSGAGTWRSNWPSLLRVPIDQALAGSGISCATKRVGRRVGSDHRPVIVDYAFAR